MTHDVVTVTANPAVDQTVWIPGFRAGEVNRVRRQEVTAGGKGVNVAAFLAAFGIETLATGFLGTSNAGLFEDFLAGRGIEERFVRVHGTTRTGVKIVDEEAGTTTDINFPGFDLPGERVTDLETLVTTVTRPDGWIVLSGSLPPGAPADLYARLREVPGYGEEKAKIFIAILAKRLGVRPDGWEEAARPFSDDTPRSVADVASEESLLEVRKWKKMQKAKKKSKAE